MSGAEIWGYIQERVRISRDYPTVYHEHDYSDGSMEVHHKTKCGRHLRTACFRHTAIGLGIKKCSQCNREETT